MNGTSESIDIVGARAWRKLHLGVDETTKEIVAVEVTPSRVHDCRLLPALLDQIPGRIVQVSGDGAYDTRACYQSILDREAVTAIPPRRSARLSESVDPPAWRAMRDTHLREIRRLGRYEWRAVCLLLCNQRHGFAVMC